MRVNNEYRPPHIKLWYRIFYPAIFVLIFTGCPRWNDYPEPGLNNQVWNLALNQPVAASGYVIDYPPEYLVNGPESKLSWAVSGGGFQWVEIYLEGPAIITSFTLSFGYDYQGEPINIYGRNKDGKYGLLYSFKEVAAGEARQLIYIPDQPWRDIEMIRVESPSSPKYMNWRELVLIGRIPGRRPPLQFNYCTEVPTLIYHNGTVITMNGSHAINRAIAISGNKILAVGSDAEILGLRRRFCTTRVIDLEGKVIMPGFNDSHAHWLSWPEDQCTATGDTIRTYPSLEERMDIVVANGWTSFSELAFGRPIDIPEHLAHAVDLDHRGQLHVRVNGFWGNVETLEQFDQFAGYPPGRSYSGKVRANGIKLYIDHPLGIDSGTYTQEEVNALVQTGYDAGWQIAAHAVNLSGVEKILRAYEQVLGLNTNDNFRYRIEHAVKVNDDQLERMKKKHIIASIQLMGPPDWPVQESHRNYISNTNPELTMRWKDFMNASAEGLRVTGSTDAPFNNSTCNYSPFRVIYQAVTRIGYYPRALDPWELNQRITILEAMELLTIDAAYATFEENKKGSLEPGKWADMIITDSNPLDFVSTPDRLLDIQVLLTVVGGRREYSKPGYEFLAP